MKKSPVVFGVSAGTLATCLILVVKHYQLPNQDIIIPAIPVLVGVLFSILHFARVYLQLDTRAEKVLKKRIAHIEKALNSNHLTPQGRSNLQKQLQDSHEALLRVNSALFKAVK